MPAVLKSGLPGSGVDAPVRAGNKNIELIGIPGYNAHRRAGIDCNIAYPPPAVPAVLKSGIPGGSIDPTVIADDKYIQPIRTSGCDRH